MSTRVAHVISTRGVGGAERILAALVARGEVEGCEQLVLNPFAQETSARFAALCRAVPYKGQACSTPAQLPALRRWLHSNLTAFRPDIVHVMLFHAAVMTASLPRRGEARLLTQVYDHTLRARPHSWARLRLDRWAGRRFDWIVAISDSVRDYLVHEQGHPSEKIVRVSPGWEGQPLPPRRDDSRPTVVCVAKFRPEKGHRILLAAFQRVSQEIPEARLVLVGDGELEGELKSLVAAQGMDESVEFAGAVAEVWPVLARAHVFAMASISEAFGIAVVEAMAAGLPVVVPAVGGLPELVTPGITGELFSPGDADALARALVTLLRSPDLRQRMEVAAREAAELHKMERSVARYLALYDELLRHRQQSSA